MRKANGFLAIVAIVLAACSSGGGVVTPQDSDKNPCKNDHSGHNGPGGQPFVCINYQTFDQAGVEPSPNPIQGWQADAIQFWFYNVGSANPKLKLDFDPNTQSRITAQVCKDEHCVVVIDPNALQDTLRKYKITDTVSGRYKDPEILIEP